MSVEIVQLHNSHLDELVTLHRLAGEMYNRYFIPFDFQIAVFTEFLFKAKQDVYRAVLVDTKLSGFYMLRGWDAGYAIPSYGVWIGQDFQRRGLALKTLQDAVIVARSRKAKFIMLKVHPENLRAKGIYEEFGFKQQGTDEKNNNLVYYYEL
jgi:ribosomal-protein-alanine N-acetyltransferase